MENAVFVACYLLGVGDPRENLNSVVKLLYEPGLEIIDVKDTVIDGVAAKRILVQTKGEKFKFIATQIYYMFFYETIKHPRILYRIWINLPMDKTAGNKEVFENIAVLKQR